MGLQIRTLQKANVAHSIGLHASLLPCRFLPGFNTCRAIAILRTRAHVDARCG
jgi:hypothetical protein